MTGLHASEIAEGRMIAGQRRSQRVTQTASPAGSARSIIACMWRSACSSASSPCCWISSAAERQMSISFHGPRQPAASSVLVKVWRFAYHREMHTTRVVNTHGARRNVKRILCGAAMRLVRREPHPVRGPEYELQTYKCRGCGNQLWLDVPTPGADEAPKSR